MKYRRIDVNFAPFKTNNIWFYVQIKNDAIGCIKLENIDAWLNKNTLKE